MLCARDDNVPDDVKYDSLVDPHERRILVESGHSVSTVYVNLAHLFFFDRDEMLASYYRQVPRTQINFRIL